MPWVGFTLVIQCPFSGESQTLSLSTFCAWLASPERTPAFSFSGGYKPGCQHPGSQMGKGARKGISQISVNFHLTPCFHQSLSLSAVLTSPGSDPSGLISPETKTPFVCHSRGNSILLLQGAKKGVLGSNCCLY